MRRGYSAFLALTLCLTAAFPGCGGCSSPSQGEPLQTPSETSPEEGGDTQEDDLPFGVGAFLPVITFRMEGEPDTHNLYPSVVRVTPEVSDLATRLHSCSGVIISPRLVLTAGHCVCRRHQATNASGAVEQRVDGTLCANAATVDVFFYEYAPRMPPPSIASQTTEQLQGKVRPHPHFEVRMDASGDILSSNADLAVIALDKPVPVGFLPSRLAKTDVTLQEPLVLAGFGHDQDLGMLDTIRLIHTSKVTAIQDGLRGRFRLAQDESDFFRGDSGGPCFRTSSRKPLLVGIATTGLGHEPTMVAIRDHLAWLQEEIARAETTESIP